MLSLTLLLVQAVIGGAHARLKTSQTRLHRLALHGLTAVLHMIQPFARLVGRLKNGLNPWRRRGPIQFTVPRSGHTAIWTEQWLSMNSWLREVEAALRKEGHAFLCGGAYDSWDFEVRGGMLGSTRIRTALEEHGSGRQLFRIKWWSRIHGAAIAVIVFLGSLSVAAVLDDEIVVSVALGLAVVLLVTRAVHDCGMSTSATRPLGMLTIRNTHPEPAHTKPAIPTGPSPETPESLVKGESHKAHLPALELNAPLDEREARIEPNTGRRL
jgi:O-antigen biosynthesis protein